MTMRLPLWVRPFLDLLLVPFIYPSAWLLGKVRRIGVHTLPRSRKALLNVGVFPIRDHYFEPQFDHRYPRQAFAKERDLSGIDWNTDEQLHILNALSCADELATVPLERSDSMGFYMNNDSFGPGDAEYWYQAIRYFKPKRIFEVGSGNSTLMAIRAIEKNRMVSSGYQCRHVCIEPYEMPWLEETGVDIIRKAVEEVDLKLFAELEENDILFIDSSHVIRPQGDVLYEYLEILPSLKKGVIVHIHDIFSPRNYPEQWLRDEVRLWNEQYLLEAFLCHNSHWKVIGALNYLSHHHYHEVKKVAPFLPQAHEPGSFYIQKTA